MSRVANLEAVRVEQQPNAWLSDLAPNVSCGSPKKLVIKGDPVLPWETSAVIYVLVALVAIGVPWLMGFSFETTAQRVGLCAWVLFIFSLPLWGLAFRPNVFTLDGTSRNIIIHYGFWKRKSAAIAFDDVQQVRIKKVYYFKINSKIPERIETYLAYAEFRPEANAISSFGPLLGIAMLSVDIKTMETFVEYCGRFEIQVRLGAGESYI